MKASKPHPAWMEVGDGWSRPDGYMIEHMEDERSGWRLTHGPHFDKMIPVHSDPVQAMLHVDEHDPYTATITS